MLSKDQMRTLRLTRHAETAMERRNVTMEEIGAAIRWPAVVEPHNGELRFVRAGIAVVVVADKWRPGKFAIKTILWRVGHRWTDEEFASRDR